ncbi:MAG: hypothetical protein HYZ28_21890 [Myxococcales bacterium]|nr:hypothetical protein [Myxococcales bacterium]
MDRALGAALVASVLFTACFDFDDAYSRFCARASCEDGGATTDGGGSGGGGGSDGGDATDGGLIDAGSDAGPPDAGAYDAGPPDAGPPCTGSSRPRLFCQPPLVLEADAGLGLSFAVVAGNDDGFLVAYSGQGTAPAGRVELKLVSLDGGVRRLRSLATPAPIRYLALSGAASHWAMSYVDDGTLVHCHHSSGDAGVAIGPSTRVDGTAISVSRAGDVGLIARREFGGASHLATQAGGCPSSLRPYSFVVDVQGVGAGHMSGLGLEGFRFSVSGTANIYNGDVAILRLANDGGVEWAARWLQAEPYYDHAAVVSESGDTMIVAADTDLPDGGSALMLKAMPTDLTPILAPSRKLIEAIRWWNITTCGAGCTATIATPKFAPGNIPVFFVGDDENLFDLGAVGYDFACNKPFVNVTAGIGFSKGQLGILFTTPTRAEFSICRPPAF